MTGYAEWRALVTGGGRKTGTLETHARGGRFRTGESAMNLTWRFSDQFLAPGTGRIHGAVAGPAGPRSRTARAPSEPAARPRRTRPVAPADQVGAGTSA